jgi:hypothetical protein
MENEFVQKLSAEAEKHEKKASALREALKCFRDDNASEVATEAKAPAPAPVATRTRRARPANAAPAPSARRPRARGQTAAIAPARAERAERTEPAASGARTRRPSATKPSDAPARGPAEIAAGAGRELRRSILAIVAEAGADGARYGDIAAVHSDLSRSQLTRVLSEMMEAAVLDRKGIKNGARYYALNGRTVEAAE